MSERSITRREAITLAGAALSLGNQSAVAEDSQQTVDRLRESLADEVISELSKEPEILAHVSTKEFWEGVGKGTDNIDLKQKLIAESQVHIPSQSAITDLKRRGRIRIREHSSKLSNGEFGIFVDGEHSRAPKKEQVAYLTTKINGEVTFVLGFPVSTSFADWSSVQNSNGTPLGTYPVRRIERRLFGQLASNVIEHPEEYINFPKRVEGKTVNRYFPKSIHSGDKSAAITSGVFWIDERRNIGGHGSNKAGGLGYPASSGCIRMPNMAFFYLLRFIKNGAPWTIHGIPLTPEEKRISDLIGTMEYK